MQDDKGYGSLILRWPLLGLLLWSIAAASQPIAWPIATLKLPEADIPPAGIVTAAVAGNFAVTAYGPYQNVGYRVFVRERVEGIWQPPQLIAQGAAGEGQYVQVAADGDAIAIGLPHPSHLGHVDVYRHSTQSGWAFEQSLPAPPSPWSGTGQKLSLRLPLLVVQSSFGWGNRIDAFHRGDGPMPWQSRGFKQQPGAALYGSTNGTRVAACGPGTCSTSVPDEQGQWISEASTGPSSNSAVVDGDWLFEKTYSGSASWFVGAYSFDGGAWQLKQNFGIANSGTGLVARGGTMATGAGTPAGWKIYSLD